jgi:hypothetical protein
MTVKEQVFSHLEECNELTVKELVLKTGASKQLVHRALHQFTEGKLIQKIGRTPKTSYRLLDQSKSTKILTIPELNEDDLRFLEEHCLLVDETGKLLRGPEAFTWFCNENDLGFDETLAEFKVEIQSQQKLHDRKGKIKATDSFLNYSKFGSIWLDNLFYFDFDRTETFGRTPLATLIYYSKMGQSSFLMNVLIEEIKDKVLQFLSDQQADAVAFVPPTLGREIQLMKFLKANLNISLPHIPIKKINGLVPQPQYSILQLDNKIKNADNTYMLAETRHFKHVILFDDHTDSGATLNQLAGKLKLKGIAAEVSGLAIVGSY